MERPEWNGLNSHSWIAYADHVERELDRLTARDRDATELIGEMNVLSIERDAELDRLRPVVLAAEKWRKGEWEGHKDPGQLLSTTIDAMHEADGKRRPPQP